MESSFPENEVLIIITIGIILMLLVAISFILFFYFSQKKFQAERLKAQERELRYQEQLLYSSIQTQEKERQRIARELHDDIGSKLNVINLGLHRLRKTAEGPLGESVEELFSVIDTTIDTTRRISHDLLPPTLENFGLVAALEELCEHYRNASDVEVDFELCSNERPIDDRDTSLSLFRVAQELMSNSFKYAEAKHISVKLWQGQRNSRLSYQDDGKGFDQKLYDNKKGLGMQNIESRMRMIGAEHSFESAPGKGVFFTVSKQLAE